MSGTMRGGSGSEGEKEEKTIELNSKFEEVESLVPKVNPRGTSKEYKYGTELDRDYNASLNILERGMLGQGLPFVPSEVEPLRELIPISASSIVEVGSPLR